MKIDLATDRHITVDSTDYSACLWLSDGSLSACTYLTAEECRKLAGALLEVADELGEDDE